MPAVLPVEDIQALFDAQWNTQNGTVPEPTFVVTNDGVEPPRINLNRGDYITIKPGQPAEKETLIGTWVYGHRVWPIVLELATKNGRQRLWDLKDEIRRICHARIHSMTNFQRIQYQQFSELVEEELNVWKGRIEIELVSSAVLAET